MQIIVNGEAQASRDAVSVAELLAELAVAATRVAVEVNEEIVPRDAYGTRRLASGDRVEIVHFVGGG
jgi:thiamine biosynthesis protein ThiS